MPFYQYRATDSTGRMVEGKLQAVDSNAAREALLQAGMKAVDVIGLNQPPAMAPAMASRGAPTHRTQTLGSEPQQVAETRTKPGSDKDRFFLFSQMAAGFRAGINPAQMFADMRVRCPAHYAPSMDALYHATSEGMPISDVMARFPDLYPHHVVGLTRAGEQGGFLPDALDEVAEQAQSAHKFRRFFFWIWVVAINALISIPLIWVATAAFLRAYDEIDKNGGAMDVGGALGVILVSFVQQLIWPWGPVIAAIYFGLWWLKRYLSSPKALHLRHTLGLKYPVFGPRARQENLARFSWTMSRLSRSGIAPARAWQLAAESVPNVAMRDLLSMGGSGWLEGREKLSDLIHRSGIFPEQYAPMVATAEYTGDIPGAMDRLAQMSRIEFETATNYAKLRSGGWGCLALFVTSGIVLMILMKFWYYDLIQKVLSGFDTP
jgi:type IV pilus assembly protein PilC